MGHDPGEMLKKIDELEKGLPHGNRPEVLYARSHLLMAETVAKLLYVFIDISQKIDRLIDTIVERSDVETKQMHELHDRVRARLELQKNIPPPMSTKEAEHVFEKKDYVCTVCNDEVQHLVPSDDSDSKSAGYTCNCDDQDMIPEGLPWPSKWVSIESYTSPTVLSEEQDQLDRMKAQAAINEKEDSRQQVSSLDEDEGLGEFKDDEQK